MSLLEKKGPYLVTARWGWKSRAPMYPLLIPKQGILIKAGEGRNVKLLLVLQ